MTSKAIEAMISKKLAEIGAAASEQNLAKVAALTRQASELEDMKKTVLNIEQRLKELPTTPDEKIAAQAPTINSRVLPIEVSQGMINQNLLTLTEHVKRGIVSAGEDMIIEVIPSGERFRTELVVNGNKLRERGAIGRFYKETKVKEGDFVVLTESEPNRWKLHKAEAGQYKSWRDASNFLM